MNDKKLATLMTGKAYAYETSAPDFSRAKTAPHATSARYCFATRRDMKKGSFEALRIVYVVDFIGWWGR